MQDQINILMLLDLRSGSFVDGTSAGEPSSSAEGKEDRDGEIECHLPSRQKEI